MNENIIIAISNVILVIITTIYVIITGNMIKLQAETFQANAGIDTEKLLSNKDFESVFEMHGIDLKSAKQDGVTPQDIAYLNASLYRLSIHPCNEIKKYLKKGYRQNMIQKKTKVTWKYARRMFSEDKVKVFDEWLGYKDTENPLTPGERIKNECRRIHNRAQESLKQNPEDYIAQGEKKAALDILAFVEEVEKGTL